jgi:hypothetical protein
MTQRTRKRLEALPSAGIYIRYERRPSRRRQSQREMLRVLRRVSEDLNSFKLDERLTKFAAELERFANSALRRFVKEEGLLRLDPCWRSMFKGQSVGKRLHLIKQRIQEIQAEAKIEESKARERFMTLNMRQRLAGAYCAADALEIIDHVRFVPVYVKHANLPKEGELAIEHAISAAFEAGRAFERVRIRSFEAYARTAISKVKKTRERNKQQMSPKIEERLHAYQEKHRGDPTASHWALCTLLANNFSGNRGRRLTPRAFSNSIPKSERVKA